jgi:hypothetical protein
MVRESARKVGRPVAASRSALFPFTASLRRRLDPRRLAPLGLAALLLPAGAAGAESLSLRQVLEQGLADSPQLERSQRQLERDEALVALNRSLLLPQLDLVGLGSYTQVGTSVGVLTNLPTLGDISLSLENGGYALLRNSFGNAGVVLGADLLPLRQFALIAASAPSGRAAGPAGGRANARCASSW